jgi:hypothetical protein
MHDVFVLHLQDEISAETNIALVNARDERRGLATERYME